MRKLKIIMDEETLSISRFQQISGNIYVQLDDYAFPSENWHDLSASILAMWLVSVNNHLLGYENTTTLFFMDGDYSIRLVRRNSQESLVSFLDPNERCILNDAIDMRYFGRQLLAASTRIINHFPKFAEGRAIDELIRLSSTLRTTIQNIKHLPL